MRHSTACLALATCVAVSPLASAATAPPVAAYAALPASASPRLSPDGKSIAMIGAVAGREAFVIAHMDGTAPKVFTTGGWTPDWIAWKSPTTLVAGVRTTWREPESGKPHMISRLLVLAADGSRMMPIDLTFTRGRSTRVPLQADRYASLLPSDPDHILMRTLLDTGPAVSRIDLKDGSRSEVQDSRLDVRNWFADEAGIVRAGFAGRGPSMMHRQVDMSLIARSGPQDGWHTLLTYRLAGGRRPEIAGFVAGDPDLIVLATDGTDGYRILQTWRISTQAPERVLARVAGEDVTPIRQNSALIGYRSEGQDRANVYFDPGWSHDAAAIGHALEGGNATIIDRQDGGRFVLAELHEPGHPEEFWLLDRSGPHTTLKRVLGTYDQVPQDSLSPQRPIVFTARDGMRIPALLTLPKGASGPIPFVVFPHGGPTAHDEPEFDWMVQFIASRGYGVLQPQFRGSTGFGRALENAGDKQWGRSMQDDITDGTKYLVAQHLADPARIAIAGASFGGYAALEGTAREPSLYRCAAAWAPVTDLPLLVGGMQAFSESDLNLPNPGTDYATIAAVSPVNAVANITVPVLLVHGRDDFTVPVEHSQRMEAALRRGGKPVEAIYVDHADHYLSSEDSRLQFLGALDRFLARNLGHPS